MKQAIIKSGVVKPETVPSPIVGKGEVLIRLEYSCISAGTEMSSVNNSGKSLLRRALDQPENVKKVIDSMRNDGISKALNKVKSKVEGGNATGYSISGKVIGVGSGVEGFKIGQHVAAAGAGFANHAEIVSVPKNLVTHVPENLDLSEASTVTLGAIALQGVRRIDVKLGEYVVVVGCGILGLIAIQLLIKSGARVIAIDLDDSRLEIAKSFGCEQTINPKIENPVEKVSLLTKGKLSDYVLFAAATSSSEPLSQSFNMCRKKGTVVLLGVVGMEIKRQDIYVKEIDFKISTSYGPGRYDDSYEIEGKDYPYGYVRWTENRNMSEYLRLVANKSVNLTKLIDNVYDIEQVEDAYNSLKSVESKPLIVLLKYDEKKDVASETKVILNTLNTNKFSKSTINYALIGAGSFALGMHMPNLTKLKGKYHLSAVMSRKGHSAKVVGEQYGADYVTTSYQEILSDDNIDLVIICTRHDSHGDLVLKALNAGKNVFVEKPLAVNQDELNSIKEFYLSETTQLDKPVLMVGFNRRFSQFSNEIKKHTSKRLNPLFIRYRMNAGFIPLESWHHDHGGRIVGEACHIIDFVSNLTDSSIESIKVEKLDLYESKFSKEDNMTIVIKYSDGSIGSIDYFATGNKGLNKEVCEIHFDGKSIILDDYKTLKGYGLKIKEFNFNSSKKGQYEEILSLHECLTNSPSKFPIPLVSLLETTQATLDIINNK
jgi:predicted dehydrogenase/threonine dehydrogenase-like Zn-dependent dehydrogenase